MDIDGLKDACDDAVKRWESNKQLGDYPSIPLVVPQYATGYKTKLCGTYGPYCEWIANVQEGKGTVAYWDARKILKFIHQKETKND